MSNDDLTQSNENTENSLALNSQLLSDSNIDVEVDLDDMDTEQRKTFRRLTENLPAISEHEAEELAKLSPDQVKYELKKLKKQTW